MANNAGSKFLSLLAIAFLVIALATSGAFSANNGNGKGVKNSPNNNWCHGYGPSKGKNANGRDTSQCADF